METSVTYQNSCRVCEGSLHDILNLGKLYPSAFVERDELDKGEKVPLILSKCDKCGLVQLRHTVDLDWLYRKYFYKSSLNRSMDESLKDVVAEIEKYITLYPQDVVIDIGCNDATLFKHYKQPLIKIGFDPALNIKEEAEKECNLFINDFFPGEIPIETKAKVITAIAMFYDLPDPVGFAKAINKNLANDGIFVIQFTDLLSMLQINAFDNICFEHLEYYTIADIEKILDLAGMEIFHISRNNVNGGSVRIFACKYSTRNIESSVYNEKVYETDFFEHDTIDAFAKRINKIKRNVLTFLKDCEDIVIFGLGASTKGNTLLQYFGITTNQLKKIAEVNPDKFGKYTLGSGIPILSQKDALKEKPEMFFVLPWHFISTFIKDFDEFLHDGGVLFVPLPEPVIYFCNDLDEVVSLPISLLCCK